MIEVNETNIQEFIRLLIECGEYYKILPDHTIQSVATDQLVTVERCKTARPIRIVYTGAPCDDMVEPLNPFKENIGKAPAKEWFLNTVGIFGGIICKIIFLKVVQDAAEKKDDNIAEYDLMSKILGKVDETTKTEIEKIGSQNFVSVFYNKTTKMAEAQTRLFSEDLREEFPKIRKKTWEVIDIIFSAIFGPDKEMEDYRYKAKLLNIPETEAKLNVDVAILDALNPYSKDILKRDLHTAELKAHLEVLEGYSHLYEWATANRVEQPKAQTPMMPPWQQNVGMTPTMMSMGTTSASGAAELTPDGQVRLSTYFGNAMPAHLAGMQQSGYVPMGAGYGRQSLFGV